MSIGDLAIPTVPVVMKGPIGPIVTRELPTHTSYDNRYVGSLADKILSRDSKRKVATIISFDQDIYLGENIGDVQNSSGAGATRWPALTPLVVTGNNELYIASASTSESTNISIVLEVWQDSEDET